MFVDRAAFEEALAAHRFLEWNEHFGNLYGTPLPSPHPGRDLLLEIEVKGAEQVREHHPEAVIIFVVPPSAADQEARLRARGEPEENIATRMARAGMEEEIGRRIADAVVVNDDLAGAVDEVAGILERCRAERAGDDT